MGIFKDQFDKLLIAYVLQIILILLVLERDSHDLVVFLMGAITTLLGSLTTLTHSSSAAPVKSAIINEASSTSTASTPDSGDSKRHSETINIK